MQGVYILITAVAVMAGFMYRPQQFDNHNHSTTKGRQHNMAQQIVITMTDDMDPKQEATGTHTFALDGITYEIDLSDRNRERLDKALAPFVTVARTVGKAKGSKRKGGTVSAQQPGRHSAAREWARAQGLTVPDKGRVPTDILDQYDAAQAASGAA